MHANEPLVTPGAIIGYRRNGTPIRLIAGGAPEGDGDGGTGQDGAGTGDGQQGSTQNDDGGTGTGGQGGDGGTGSTEPGTQSAGTPPADDSAARTIAAVRDDFKRERAQRQALQKQLDDMAASQTRAAEETKQRNLALAKALGIATDEPPDPEQLARELAAEREAKAGEVAKAQARERELTVELELLKQARKHGADPELLVDSRSFMSRLGSLDPASDDFAGDLGEAIKAAVEANPGFKLAAAAAASSGTSNAAGTGKPAGDGDGAGNGAGNGARTTAPPARSGGEHNGAPGGNRQWTDADVTKASAQEVEAAINAGLLVDLGFSPRKQGRRSRR